MPRVNWKQPVSCVFCLSLAASICVIALPTVGQQTPVDPREEIARVSKELSEKPSESLAKNALPDRVTTLLKAKRHALRMRYEAFVQFREQGGVSGRNSFGEDVFLFSKARADWIDAELDLTTIAADRIKLLRVNADAAVQFESGVLALRDAGAEGGSYLALTAAQAAKFDAELRLARELVAQPAKTWK